MNLYTLLRSRAEDHGPVRVGVIGAGKFASMFFTQVLGVPEMHVVGVVDLDVAKARAALGRTGWPEERYACTSYDEALRTGGTVVADDAAGLIEHPQIEVVVEITGNPLAGVEHAVRSIDNGKHVVMVNVEADCLVGPLLRRRAQQAGVVYSMAYGDQPALIAELVDWCRTVGYEVVAAGKGTKYLPDYRFSTPDTVWDHYGFSTEKIAAGDFNPKMFNSFLDGTKSAIEMAAVANATGLKPQQVGLQFPPASVNDLSTLFRPATEGGILEHSGTVEIASCLERDGRSVEQDLRWGVYVTFKARTEYAAACFAEYGMVTDPSGYYGSLYRPYHLIGMELGVSIASAVLRGEPTGSVQAFEGDAVTTAKRDLCPGDVLDGEGGYCVYGQLQPAEASTALGALPIGLAHGVKVTSSVREGQPVTWKDVEVDDTTVAVALRREMERDFR
ncbi:NAD(P)H-dependent oxidoreductase [Pseudonocardia sp. MH-G8]|uniref:NAD(P)H-dependent oxidoreductase n=1 Tax=Pseudonocardia sp. MH-G8 TaxID=1854588 RepID=UPI000BA02E1A|nr:SAF domain-containing protein [Pseudonocardia sp. MH-G8]OZM76920.1 flagellar biosynthesis protein FlgA [Pseudonocardia sp. MH-G8]